MKINLHSHSTASDGKKSPEELAQLFKKHNLDIVALTDHDTVAGQKAFIYQCRKERIHAITGIELTGNCSNTPLKFFNSKTSIHMVALGFDLSKMEEELSVNDHLRDEVVIELINTMNHDGWNIGTGDFKRYSRLMKSHVADWLIDHDYADNQDDAFSRIINRYPQRRSISYTPYEVIQLVHRCGGLIFLAHPYDVLEGRNKKHLTATEVEQLVEWLIPQGIDGIEAQYMRFTESERKHLFAICDKYDLKYSIGTDYHGKRDTEIIDTVITQLPDWLGAR